MRVTRSTKKSVFSFLNVKVTSKRRTRSWNINPIHETLTTDRYSRLRTQRIERLADPSARDFS